MGYSLSLQQRKNTRQFQPIPNRSPSLRTLVFFSVFTDLPMLRLLAWSVIRSGVAMGTSSQVSKVYDIRWKISSLWENACRELRCSLMPWAKQPLLVAENYMIFSGQTQWKKPLLRHSQVVDSNSQKPFLLAQQLHLPVDQIWSVCHISIWEMMLNHGL